MLYLKHNNTYAPTVFDSTTNGKLQAIEPNGFLIKAANCIHT